VKCTSRRKIAILSCVLLLCGTLCGCGDLAYEMPYSADSAVSTLNVVAKQDKRVVTPYAADLCVVAEDLLSDSVNMENAKAAVLCDVNGTSVLYAKNPHETLYPASLTKVMTALVALKYGSLDQVLTATSAVNITESGAQLCGLKAGDSMTLDQALRILLLYSANDVAMLIAEGVGGSTDKFIEMMNEEAKRLGATNTNFVNPHGLTEENHYTTAYDLYLIFNEAIKYETFNEITQMSSYQTTYFDKNGKAKEFNKPTTNLFIRGDYSAPANVNVMGGKTGTTRAAGNCLMLLSRDENGSPYISVILGATARDILYQEMTDLLEEIHK